MAALPQNSREAEIAQGLRHPGGALTFPLNVLDYTQGYKDFKLGNPPPRISSDSYDLGRNRARREAEETAEVMAAIDAEQERRHQSVRAMLADKPEILAEYDAKIAEIRART